MVVSFRYGFYVWWSRASSSSGYFFKGLMYRVQGKSVLSECVVIVLLLCGGAVPVASFWGAGFR